MAARRLPSSVDAGVGAEGLQVDPVVAGVRRGERAFPGDDGVGRKGVAAFDGEVELRIGLRARADLSRCARKARLAVVAERAGGNGGAGHVVVDREADVGVAGDFLHRGERADLALRQANRAFAVDADGVDLRGGGADEDDGIEFIVL